MPLFDFQHSETLEVHEVFFHMNDNKVYKGKNGDEEGKWVRLYHVPLASIDTKLDPHDKKQFIRRAEKYTTIGDLVDKSKELSIKREGQSGNDEIKRKFFDEYKNARGGKKHVQDRPSVIENARVKIELD